jgi:hypothetical protein
VSQTLSGMSYYDLVTIMEAGYDPVVISNSWGAAVQNPNYYTSENAGFDEFIYEYPSVLMLFAAGNEGQEGFSIQALSRNVLVVGSATDDKTMSDFSSAGPTIDRQGHMTVHVVTNGQGVLSASAFTNTGHVIKSGTSMATPLAAGIATLLREWLIRKDYPDARSGSLLRTMMIHCAVPLPATHKTAQGFGFLQPALLTDYGQTHAMGDYVLSVDQPKQQVYGRIATKSELFRISVGWYTPPGYSLENVASVTCLKNEDAEYTKSDPKNNLLQMTLHLEKDDEIVCWLNFIRAHDKHEGFKASVVAGTWPSYVIYLAEDANMTKNGDALMGFVRRGINPSEPLQKGTPLLGSSWPGRSVLRDLFMTDPLWIVVSLVVALGFTVYVYYMTHLPELFLLSRKRQ